MAAAMTMILFLAHSVLSRCFSSSITVMHVLYTFSCSIYYTRRNQLYSNLANLEATVEMG